MTAPRFDDDEGAAPAGRDGLTITVLGCSGTYAGPGGACSGYLVRTATTTVWLDCGPGSLANLQRHVGLDEVDGVVVTHCHPDHWLELPVATNALRYGVRRPDAALPLLWTAETAGMFRHVAGPTRSTFDDSIVDEHTEATIGDIELSFSRTDHPVETLAVRAASGGRSLAYSADTGSGWALTALGPDRGRTIGLAVVEATLDEEDRDTVDHLTATQAGEMAGAAGVASLLLTHLAPGSDPERRAADAAATFAGPIAVAELGAVYAA